MAKSELCGFQRVLRRRRIRGRQECLVQWEPTLEPADLEDYAVGKYRPLSVSARVYLIDGELKRKVVWRPSWEPSRSVGVRFVSDSSGSISPASSRGREVRSLGESGLAPGWQLRMSARHNNLYFYCPKSKESSWDVPKGTSKEVAILCLETQCRMCIRQQEKKSGVVEKS
jgi:hypothetical protein